MAPRTIEMWRACAGLASLALGACAEPAPEDRAPREPWSIDRAEVLFTGRREGVSDLYLYDRELDETTRLTSLGTADGGANAGRISPDGRRIAFQLRRGTDYEIHLLDRAGGTSRNLTRHPEYDVSPAWSPDSRRIAFMSTRGFELGSLGPFPGHIYVHVLGTDSLRQVTREPLTSSLGPSDWSADGARLLIARDLGEGPDVYSLDVTRGTETRLTESAEAEYSAAFSHAGDRIAYHAESESAAQIVVLDLATGRRQVLTSGPGFRYSPRWSPDDQWLLFAASETGEQYDLRAVRIADGRVIELVATDEDEREGEWVPVWTP